MRTDVGTFGFQVHPDAECAKITLEYPGTGAPKVVFYLCHHPPEGKATVQLSGHLLEVEADGKRVKATRQHDPDGMVRKWDRDDRCVLRCGRDRMGGNWHVCRDCLEAGVGKVFIP